MQFYALDPEVAGELGEHSLLDASVHPPIVKRLHYHFQGWLGDDLVQSFPVFLVSDRLRRAMEAAKLSGGSFDDAEVSVAEDFGAVSMGRSLPGFSWLKVTGIAQRDDLGVAGDDYCLVVSEGALNCMRRFALENCAVTELGAQV
ncbi:MAG: hypothetical protein ABI565_14580 [Vicinamibacteria bacterium]